MEFQNIGNLITSQEKKSKITVSDFFNSEKREFMRSICDESDILKSHINLEFLYEMFEEDGKKMKKLNRIYKASDHQFKAANFHKFCDDKGPTLVVCKAKVSGFVFGGYTTESWSSKEGWKSAPGSFIFQLDFKSKHIIYRYEDYIIGNGDTLNPLFGKGCDLSLSENCNLEYCVAVLGSTFSPPLIMTSVYDDITYDDKNIKSDAYEMEYNSKEANSYLAGSNLFFVSEFEVFTIEWE